MPRNGPGEFLRAIVRCATRIAALVLLAALGSALLALYSPGYGVDERLLDARRGDDSRRRWFDRPAEDRNIVTSAARVLRRYAAGDLGESSLFQRPVKTLIAERIRPTIAGAGIGLCLTWVSAMALALWCIRHGGACETTALAFAAALQCIPAAVLGIGLLAAGTQGAGRVGLGIWLVVGPRLFRLAHGILRGAFCGPYVLLARAKGLSPWQVLWRHVLPAASAPLLSLAAISFSLGISAAVPLEMVLDVPGIGQLAWQSALARDLNLLVNLTLVIGLITISASTLSDAIADRGKESGESGAKA